MRTMASVIIPSHRGAERLGRLLSWLAAQTYPHWEAVVVVDGIVDDSLRVIEAARGDGLPVRSVSFSENRGRSAALNAGLAASSGDILIRCDDDLEVPPAWIEAHVALHAVHPEGVGAVGLCRNVLADTAYARAHGFRADEGLKALAARAGQDTTWRFWGGNVSVPRRLYEQVGDYDPAFRAYGWEDVDWGYRLHRLGHAILIDPSLAARHHGAAADVRTRALRAYYSGAGQRRFDSKHGRTPPAASGRPWDRAVNALSVLETEPTVTALARTMDRALRFLPTRVGTKATALVVESAAQAGYRRPDRVGRAI